MKYESEMQLTRGYEDETVMAQPASPVRAALEQINMHAEKASAMIAHLEDQLGLVLTSQPPRPSQTPVQGRDSMGTPLLDHLRDLDERIGDFAGRIGELIERTRL